MLNTMKVSINVSVIHCTWYNPRSPDAVLPLSHGDKAKDVLDKHSPNVDGFGVLQDLANASSSPWSS